VKNLAIALATLILMISSQGQIPEGMENWPYITSTEYYAIESTPRFSPLFNADSCLVVFITSTGEVNKVYLDGFSYTNWPFIADSIIFSATPIVVDLDFDGLDEIVTYGVRRNDSGYMYSILYAFDDDGQYFTGFPIIHSRINLPNVADCDNDGQYEMIYYSKDDDLIYCIDDHGIPEPGWPISAPEEPFGSRSVCGSVGDLDGDGTLEFLLKGMHNIYGFNYDGTTVDGFPIPVYDPTYIYNEWWGVTLGDVDYDGYLEIAVSATRRIDWNYTSYVAIYEHTGIIKDGWPRFFEDDFCWQMPVIADINSDNELELGFTMDSEIYFIDMDGNNLPGWPTTIIGLDSIAWVPMSDLIVVDIDGDSDCEIFSDFNVFYYDNSNPDSVITWSYLFAADHEGRCIARYPIQIRGQNLFMPPTFKLENSYRHLYMAVYTEASWPPENFDYAFIELYQFPDSTGPPDQWPMLGHDNLMTRNYNFVDHVTAVRDGQVPLPKNYVLMQNYPNPFNASTKINFSLPKPEHVNITIYDILGRRVEQLLDKDMPAGNYELTWRADEYSSGMYFYVMHTPRAKLSRKMVLLK
jgi:hypothetical protein